MSGSTPTKRLQLKTSDLTDFFRGSPSSGPSSASNSAISEDNHLSTSSTSPSKKRSSRIPFIGRSRKKSIHSDADAETSVSSDAKESRASVATTGSNYRSVPERHTLTSLPHASTSQQSLKTTAASTSFGSKIAAHFVPSKGGLRLQRHKSQRSPKKSHEELSDYTSDSLAPPSLGPRSSSIESNLSRSSTPRASQAQEEFHPQPTITVSRPPVDDDLDNLEEYNDLFTRPRHKTKGAPTDTEPRGTYLPRTLHRSDGSPFPSPPPPSNLIALSHAVGSSVTTTRTLDESTTDPVRRIGTKSQKPSRSSASDFDRASISGASVSSLRAVPSRRKVNFGLHQGIDIDTADESEATSIKSAMSMPASFRNVTASEKHRSLISSSSVRGSTRSKVFKTTLPSKPPSIPLPATPSDQASSSLLTSQAIRQRAHTIASGRTSSVLEQSSSSASSRTNSPSQDITTVKALEKLALLKKSTIHIHSTDRNSSSSSSSSTPTLTKTFPKLETLEIDIDTASIEELRKTLRRRNQQFEELFDHLLQLTETHAAEKRAWEKKVAELEREAVRTEKNIEGLAWLVKNTPGDGTNQSVQSGSRTPSLIDMERERSDDSSVRSSLPTPSSSVRLPMSKLLPSEDSESYPTSTSEWGSGTSGAEDESQMATIKPRRTMRKLKLVESVNKTLPATRSMSLKQPGSGMDMSLSGHISDTSYPRKRSSASSSFTVASSSSISPDHSPTSLTFPSSQILNPIPESRLVGSSKENHVTFSLDKEESKRERKLSKSFGQPSAPSKSNLSSSIPSVTPGSRLTPSEAYIKNLKKGRPASIAQILDQNWKADQPTASCIEESYGGRSRALLAGINHASK